MPIALVLWEIAATVSLTALGLAAFALDRPTPTDPTTETED